MRTFKAALTLMLVGCKTVFAANAVASFLVTNNDVPLSNPPIGGAGSAVTFYTLEPNGVIDNKSVVATNGVGIGGGFFAASRLAIVPQGNDVCVFASNAMSSDIASLSAGTRTLLGNYPASLSDSGASNGIGLAANANYLYASYSGSSTIATFAIQSGCALSFVKDLFTVGLNGGAIGGMAIHGSMLITTYGDGSIESFDIAGGVPVSNGDVQNSAGAKHDHRPNGVDITSDGHFAIFGDASTVTTLEVSDISSGRLAPTVAYEVGSGWNSGTVRLSPDETMVLVSNSSGGSITAARFDRATGEITRGCTSKPLSGFYSNWVYAGGVAFASKLSPNGLLYVPEFGTSGYSSIGVVKLSVTGKTCTISEVAGSPVVDNENLATLLSIGIYSPRQL